jgi:hypothetical protein
MCLPLESPRVIVKPFLVCRAPFSVEVLTVSEQFQGRPEALMQLHDTKECRDLRWHEEVVDEDVLHGRGVTSIDRGCRGTARKGVCVQGSRAKSDGYSPEEIASCQEATCVEMLEHCGDIVKIVLEYASVGRFAAALGNESVQVVQPRWTIIVGQ